MSTENIGKFQRGKLTSTDGVDIGYYVRGNGPAIILVQGAMGTAQSWLEFADILSDSFTVYLPDRRGRGISPAPFSAYTGLNQEAIDLQAIVGFSSARFVFGLSSGAVALLFALSKGLPVEKAIAYEPPLYSSYNYPRKYMDAFYRDLESGRMVAAFYDAGCAINPRLRLFPYWLFQAIFPVKGKKIAGALSYDREFGEMVSSLAFDFKLVSAFVQDHSFVSAIHAKVGLMGGDKSPDFLKQGLDILEREITQSQRVTIVGADHATMWDYDKKRNPHSDPDKIARVVKEFFLSPER